MASTLTESSSNPQRSWGDFRSKPTEAKPKHSLFGSTLERLDSHDRKALEDLNIDKFQAQAENERKLKQDRYKVKVPSHLKEQLRAQEEPLEHTKDEVLKQLNQTHRARQLMNLLEEKSKYFSVGFKEGAPQESGRPHSSQWMSARDLDHASDINILGVGGTTSFNHQKYKSKPPTHKYVLAGNPLNLGMDYPGTQTVPPERKPFYHVEKKGPPDRMPREFYMKDTPPSDDFPCAIKLPQNIKHQFGTKECRRILSDAHQVENTIQHLEKRQHTLNKSSPPRLSLDGKQPAAKINPDYKSLGDALRQDFFPGHTHKHKVSLAHSVYTEEVHRQRVPVPDQYRYQRDQLSTWAEQNVLRDRMKKAWDSHVTDSAPKN